MRSHLTGIDHCVVLVRDFEQARDTYTRLGFTVSPLGRHGVEMGTGNHNVMFEDHYVELLGILRPTEFNQDIADALTVRQGIAGLALRTDDVTAAVAEVRADGITTTEPKTVRRPVGLPDGSEAEAAFSTANFPEVATTHLRLFCSQVLTPGHTWIPSFTGHANTAWGIDHLAIVTEAPEALSADFARLLDIVPQRIADEEILVSPGGAPIVSLTRAALVARYPEVDLSAVPLAGPAVLSIKVRDAAAAAQHLRCSAVPFKTTAEGLLISPEDACGVLLVLRETEL